MPLATKNLFYKKGSWNSKKFLYANAAAFAEKKTFMIKQSRSGCRIKVFGSLNLFTKRFKPRGSAVGDIWITLLITH